MNTQGIREMVIFILMSLAIFYVMVLTSGGGSESSSAANGAVGEDLLLLSAQLESVLATPEVLEYIEGAQVTPLAPPPTVSAPLRRGRVNPFLGSGQTTTVSSPSPAEPVSAPPTRAPSEAPANDEPIVL